MALEAAISQHLFGHNSAIINNTSSSSSSNKDHHLFPLLLETWSSDPTNNIHDPSTFFLHFHDNNSSTFNNNDDDFYNSSCYFLDNQLEFDWHSYYNQHGIINHDNNNSSSTIIPPSSCQITHHDLPPLNNYDHNECWGLVNSSLSPDHEDPNPTTNNGDNNDASVGMEMVMMRPKQRRRARAKKNKEEIENQRMTHIAVERNRRKQMNEYLNVLRSFMPDSYVQRGDQASIVGAAINFVKQLEHNLQSLSAKKQMKENLKTTTSSSTSCLPFQEFFTFPQFSSNYNAENHDDQLMKSGEGGGGSAMSHRQQQVDDGGELGEDVEVTMVESHALLKIRLRNPLKHLSKLVSGLHSLRLSILHLNVNTSDVGVVLYSFSLKVEDESKLSSVEEIARAVYLLLGRIKEEMSSF